jgi:hypothetical protein
VVAQLQQRREFFAGEFVDAGGHVVREDEFEEGALAAAEVLGYGDLRTRGAFFAGQGSAGVGDVGERIVEVALLCIDDALHLGELGRAKAALGEAGEQAGTRIGIAPERAELSLVAKKLREFAAAAGALEAAERDGKLARHAAAFDDAPAGRSQGGIDVLGARVSASFMGCVPVSSGRRKMSPVGHGLECSGSISNSC